MGINYCANNLGNNYYPAMFEGNEEFEAFQGNINAIVVNCNRFCGLLKYKICFFSRL